MRTQATQVLLGETTRPIFDAMVRTAARGDPIVVRGEPGTGKQAMSELLHAGGPRRDAPFVACTCGPSTASRAVRCLFGDQHVRGLLDAAGAGTLLLQDIEALWEELGVRLLETRRAPSLVFTTTASANPSWLGDATTFELPPLRERPDEIETLAELALRSVRAEPWCEARRFDRGVIAALREYPWPGNVRELMSAIEHAGARSRGTWISRDDLPVSITGWMRQRQLTRDESVICDANGERPGNDD